jgi:hypothetical protein
MTNSQKRFLKLITAVQDAYRNRIYEALRAQINYFADNWAEGVTVTELPTKKLNQALRGIYESAGLQNALYVQKQIKRNIRKATPLDPIEKLRWMTNEYYRQNLLPRDQYDHLHMNAREVGYNELFIVPSTKSIDAMQYPGDPTASAGNVCNCRCTVAFVPVRDGAGNLIPMSRVMPSAGNQFLRIATTAASFTISNLLINELIAAIENDNF